MTSAGQCNSLNRSEKFLNPISLFFSLQFSYIEAKNLSSSIREIFAASINQESIQERKKNNQN